VVFFIKEGYFADLVIVNAGLPWSVKKENIFCLNEFVPPFGVYL
jgi:hypothetical protein